jgi:hypothetical protein
MAVQDATVTRMNRREIASSGIGSDPKAIATFEALQEFAFDANPAAAAGAQEAADEAAAAAAVADAAAAAAQTAATTAATSAGTAQGRADEAYDLAADKVDKSTGAAWAPPTGTLSRATLASYTAATISNPPTQAEVQAVADAVQAMSRALAAVITDLRATEALKP